MPQGKLSLMSMTDARAVTSVLRFSARAWTQDRHGMSFRGVARVLCCGVIVLSLVAVTRPGRAEEAASSITLEEAVAFAVAHHPTLRFSAAREDAARARADEARTTDLPGLGVSAQVNRSTGNTVPGTFFPTSGFPGVAGAPRGRSFDSGAFQTGVSLWSSWDVLSLVRQAAQIDLALAGTSEAEASSSARRLEVAYYAADSFLALLEAKESVKAARGGVERARVFGGVVKSLVAQSLRPGVDAARVDAELAAAETELARAEQSKAARSANFAQALGDARRRFEPAAVALIGPVDASGLSRDQRPGDHPLMREAAAAADRARKTQSVAKLEFLPRIEILGALWLRGSGFYGSPAAGLGPDVPNWAIGAALTWSALDIPKIQARARAAGADAAAQAARRDETELAIAGQMESASALLRGALRVAETTPIALSSAHQAEEQALARYRAGLTQAIEVADAERLLTQAEVNDALARLAVRRAELLVARAAGDLGPFLACAREGKH
jgi:outer membrane protein